MSDTLAPPADLPAGARPALAAGVLFTLAGFKLLLHLVFTGRFGYGFFVDELYFLACSEHLDLGFVDLPPLLPLLTAGWRALFGESLLALRLVPALAGAGLVLLTGALAREMGGGRFAQGIAALAVITAPIFLVLHSIHTMNALDPLLWMGGALVVLRIANGASERLWLVFGLLCGLGINNKHSMALFGASVAAGLLASPLRSAFRRRWIWLAGLLAFVLFLPNLVWMVQHRFPHLEQLANIRASGRDVVLSPLAFLAQQVLLFHPLAAPLWIAGLAWLLFSGDARRYRALGITWLVLMGLMLVLHGRVYYPAPAYPMLLAAGGIAFARWVGRPFPRLAYAGLLVGSGTLLAPTMLPCLPPETYVRYVKALGVGPPPIERHRLGPLPQLLADRFGWPEMAQVVARAYHALPAEERRKAAIFGQNYGQAGAIDLYGPGLGLPKALSGHLSYHLWGPRGNTGEVVLVLDDDRESLERLFGRVELAGRVEHPYSMPYQHFDVWICRDPKASLAEIWPRLKKYD